MSSGGAANPGNRPPRWCWPANLLYLTPAHAELTERSSRLLRDYELEAPDAIPDGAVRMATMWSMIPDDRGGPAAV